METAVEGTTEIPLRSLDPQTYGMANVQEVTLNSSSGSSMEQDDRELLSNDKMERRGTDKPVSGIFSAASNTINSILGSGIIGIPFAIREGGLGFSIIMIVLVAVLLDYTLILLITAGQLSGKNTYQDVGQAAFGRVGFYLVSTVQLLNPIIVMASYNIIGADTLRKLIIALGPESLHDFVTEDVLLSRLLLVIGLTMLISLPLSCLRHITHLGKFSFVSVLAILFLAIFVVVRYFTLGLDIPPTPNYLNFFNLGVLKGINIMSLTYVCHHNAFLVYDSLKSPASQWNRTVHVSMSFSALIVLLVGMFGYLSFTGHTQGDLLENYCYHDIYADVTRVVFTLIVMLTFPVECFVAREVLDNIFFRDRQPQTITRHVTWTIVIVITAFGFSLITDCLGIVLEVNGVLTATTLAIILPPLVYVKIKPEPLLSRGNILPICVLTFGSIVFLLGLGLVIDSIATGKAFDCSHGKQFSYCETANMTAS